jgi:hypothetical protein
VGCPPPSPPPQRGHWNSGPSLGSSHAQTQDNRKNNDGRGQNWLGRNGMRRGKFHSQPQSTRAPALSRGPRESQITPHNSNPISSIPILPPAKQLEETFFISSQVITLYAIEIDTEL